MRRLASSPLPLITRLLRVQLLINLSYAMTDLPALECEGTVREGWLSYLLHQGLCRGIT